MTQGTSQQTLAALNPVQCHIRATDQTKTLGDRMKDITIQFVNIPEVSLSEYAEQLEVSNEEALAILEADVAIDSHLDTALELE